MKRRMLAALVGSLTIAAAASVGTSAQAAAGADSAQFMVVQALPDRTLDIDLNWRRLTKGSETGAVLGPFTVAPGEHQFTFRDASGAVLLDTEVELAPGSRQDLVVHRPAQVQGAPVATLYATPTSPIGVNKARVLIAHTAAVAPADVRLDGKVVFRNIANGEFAIADVPKGAHVAELLPSGVTSRPILGPLDVRLPAETATMVYAVGDTKTDSMQVIAHSVPLSAKRAKVPSAIDAGSAGLAAGVAVTPFSTGGDGNGDRWAYLGLVSGGVAGLLALALAITGSRRRFAVEASP